MITNISSSSETANRASELDLREELRRVLRDSAILYSTDEQPIRHRNGQVAPWAFYSWHATLTSRGLRLAAENLLERLQTYRSTQLVSYGYTAAPLLSACVLLGGGRYTGASIRERRKPYLSCRRIEGHFDKNRPAIVIDDSLSSGTSLRKAIGAVEEEGGEVEGALALVHFPFRGGFEWANSRGYRVETLFNIWTDLEMAKTIESFDSQLMPRPASSGTKLPNGLPPAILARQTAEAYLRSGMVPVPPTSLDCSYDAAGGTFVSFRRRADDFRVQRDGFWHFPPDTGNACSDLVFATVITLRNSLGAIHMGNLDELKIAVTFLGPLEPIAPSQLDFDRYGIVVRSRVLPNKRGGALPNTQVFISEIEQYRHARVFNANVDTYEPHDLYRHTVMKYVEPGEDWLTYGIRQGPETHWWRDAQIGERLTARAREILRAHSRGEDGVTKPRTTGSNRPSRFGETLPQFLIPARIEGAGIKLYDRGILIGYGIALGDQIDACISDAVQKARSEERFQAARPQDLDSLTIVVSVLHHPERLGNAPLSDVAKKLRRGLDALAATAHGKTTVLLPSALTYNNWSREEFVQAALAKAGNAGQCFWTTFQVGEWVDNGGVVSPLKFGFPHREPGPYTIESAESHIRLLGSYIHSSIGSDGIPCYWLNPVTGEKQHAGTSARSVHGLVTLDSAGRLLGEPFWRETAVRGYRYCLPHVSNGSLYLPNRGAGTLADCVLLAGLARSGTDLLYSAAARQLAAGLVSLFRQDGRISAFPKRLEYPDDQDYLPGGVLWALGEYCRATGSPPPVTATHAEFYRRRFSAIPNWGMAGWQPQGWRAIYDLTGDPAQAELAFECADWAIEQQLEKNGAFLEDLSPDEPSFDTGFIAEGIAAAWAIASDRGDHCRAARYEQSWRDAMRFMQTLLIYPGDNFGMAAGDVAIGGVRCMLSRSDIRIDQVSHWLSALVSGADILRRPST
ncbi:MAG: AMMECR1 domain-containing protein [Bryobacteraceae bacterium]